MAAHSVPNRAPAALAIIIPACRIRHLGEALRSIAAQTDNRFTVYVGDDASAEPLEPLISSFRDRLDLRYHRFDANLGRTNLVAHWHRCIELSGKEPWLWLFSDDDVMEPECVALFYDAIAKRAAAPVELFRFELDQIDEHSSRPVRRSDHPSFEDTESFLQALLKDEERAFRAQEHIFSRKIYEGSGGFVNFPKAIYSDHATWLSFSARHGVRTLFGARVAWRSHSLGTTSGMRGAHRIQWHEAARLYLKWLAAFSHAQGPRASRIFHRLGRDYYFREISRFRPFLTRDERREATQFAQQIFGGHRLVAFLHLYYRLVHYRLVFERLIKPYRRWKNTRATRASRYHLAAPREARVGLQA